MTRTKIQASVAAFLTALLTVLAGFVVTSCGPQEAVNLGTVPIGGIWRAELTRYQGEDHHDHPLGFVFEVVELENGEIEAWAYNGEERLEFTFATRSQMMLGFGMVVYDSEIMAELQGDGTIMEGEWRKTAAGDDDDSKMQFRAERIAAEGIAPQSAPRFSDQPKEHLRESESGANFGGVWTATFVDEDGEFPARGIFEQDGRALNGTFRTTTGDYRYLDGEVVTVAGQEELRLSAFDGAHAFLFHARFDQEDPKNISGDFWSRDKYHATFTARPATANDELPNGFDEVGLTNDEGRFTFSFPTPEGELISSSDQRFQDKVVLVEVFGTWCPNCNDSAPYLRSLYEQYHDQGLEMVGLAYEMKGEFERDARFVRHFQERHQVPYPLLVAGTSDKEQAATTLPDIEAVLSFPTKIFLDRTGKVREIYSGYDGPSTGSAHTKMKESMEALIEELLAGETR